MSLSANRLSIPCRKYNTDQIAAMQPHNLQYSPFRLGAGLKVPPHRFFSRCQRRHSVHVIAGKTGDGPSVAIVGVTGAVGQEFLRVSLIGSIEVANLIPISPPSNKLHSLSYTGSEGAKFPLRPDEVSCIRSVS